MMKSVALLSLTLGVSVAMADADDLKRLGTAADVLSEVMQTSDKAVPQDLLDKAECVIVVPGMKKGAFIIGGKFGKGFFSCRKKGVGWGPPGAVRVEGGSIGFQIGGSETDVIMLVMNERGVKRLLSSEFTLGADASVAAGPVGRTSTADTDAYMTAEILSWSRSRGAFAGISLSGATLREDLDANTALYGTKLQNKDIVLSNRKPPKAASRLLALLNKYSSRK